MPASGRRQWAALFLAVLCGILFFGLRPKDFVLANKARWLEDRPGLHFRRFSIAYSSPFIEPFASSPAATDGFSIDLAIALATPPPEGFTFILALHNGRDRDQLVIGQWRSSIVIMNGNDYAHKKKTRRLGLDTAALPAGPLFLSIVTGKEGSAVYCNGRRAAADEDLLLRIPPGEQSRLLLGNSVYGKHSWEGDLYGLAVYRRRLDNGEVAAHHRKWSRARELGFTTGSRPLALYLFEEKQGQTVTDHGGGEHHLEVPQKMRVLRKQILIPPWPDFDFNRRFLWDAWINIVGFMPFGFVALASLDALGRWSRSRRLLLAVLFCTLTSLFIEIAQSWMPSRSSTLLDLILNCAGAWAGALVYRSWAAGRR